MYGPVCEVRMAFSRGKVLFFLNESALSVIILLVLSCCLVRKHGKWEGCSVIASILDSRLGSCKGTRMTREIGRRVTVSPFFFAFCKDLRYSFFHGGGGWGRGKEGVVGHV